MCSLIPSRIDYCNAVLHGAPSYSIKKLRRVQNNAARIVLEASRRSHASPLLGTLHWLPCQHRIEYKVALLTFKVRSTSTPSYLRRLIQDRQHGHNLHAIDHYDDVSTFHDDNICMRNALFDALHRQSGTHYRKLFSVVTLLQFLSLWEIPLFPGFLLFLCPLTCCLAPAPLKLRPHGAIQICLLLLSFLPRDAMHPRY